MRVVCLWYARRILLLRDIASTGEAINMVKILKKVSASSFPDKSSANSSTPEGWKAGLAWGKSESRT